MVYNTEHAINFDACADSACVCVRVCVYHFRVKLGALGNESYFARGSTVSIDELQQPLPW